MRRLQAMFAALLTVLSASLTTVQADARLFSQLGRGSMPNPPSINDPAFQAEVLRAHNVERRLVGVRDLVWWPPLAQEAQAWANYIATHNIMTHQNQTVHGESLWLNRAGMRTVGSMIGNWSIEKRWYIVGGKHPNISTTGNWHHVGHYTQMVWAGTTHVGCAIARANGRDFLVCRYAPIGNYRGQIAFDPKGVPHMVAVTPPVPTGPAGKAGPVPAVVAAATIPDAAIGTPARAIAKRPGPPAGTAAPPPAAVEPAPPAPARAATIPVAVPTVTTGNPVPQPAAKPTIVAAAAVAGPPTTRR